MKCLGQINAIFFTKETLYKWIVKFKNSEAESVILPFGKHNSSLTATIWVFFKNHPLLLFFIPLKVDHKGKGSKYNRRIQSRHPGRLLEGVRMIKHGD